MGNYEQYQIFILQNTLKHTLLQPNLLYKRKDHYYKREQEEINNNNSNNNNK